MFVELTKRYYGAEGEMSSPVIINADQIISVWAVGGKTCIEMQREDPERFPYITVLEDYNTVKEKLCGR